MGGFFQDAYSSALGREAPLTRLFVGLCVIAFVLATFSGQGKLSMLGGMRLSEALRWGALASDTLAQALGMESIADAEPWRFLSATFVHFGILHIGFNMMALWDLGRATEQRIGSGRFTLIFAGTSIAGFLASHLWYSLRSEIAFTGGASAGLFGLIGALVGYLYAAKDPVWKQFLLRVAIYAAIFAVALPVNNAAHAGGFVAGLPLGYLFYRESRPWRRARWFGAVAAVLVLASIGSIAASQHSKVWQQARKAEIEAGVD